MMYQGSVPSAQRVVSTTLLRVPAKVIKAVLRIQVALIAKGHACTRQLAIPVGMDRCSTSTLYHVFQTMTAKARDFRATSGTWPTPLNSTPTAGVNLLNLTFRTDLVC